jgi:ADP-ribose pyrophosphatase YjhB (NUDIX family)
LVGVGAVILDRDAKRVLLIKRAREPARGRWSLPGGLVDVGESLEEALRREVLEETGLQVRVGPLVEVLDRIIYDEELRVQYHYVLVDFLCRAGTDGPREASDAEEVRWFEIGQLEDLDMTDSTLEVILKAVELREEGS